ncbi:MULTISPECIES: hypothetical protein [unclassified Microcoleus]|uniref:hypothetical protein n=1 Tax=unclassified Microcoleus TaxID=2642155 RepID=UPI002FD51776
MAIELSNLTFTNRADIVPASGVEEILNTGVANPLGGNDIITGTGKIVTGVYSNNFFFVNISGFYNNGTLNTAHGNDIITGTVNGDDVFLYDSHAGILNNYGIIHTDDGNDIITGILQTPGSYNSPTAGIYNHYATINTGDGNDIITGTVEGIITGISQVGVGIQSDYGTIYTGDGNDTITGTGSQDLGIFINYGGTLDTGKGNDVITGIGRSGINNFMATFNTGDGNDIITGTTNELYGWGIRNSGSMDTGNGNDVITGTNIIGGGVGIWNEEGGNIDTGDGNDIITAISQAGLYNFGSINTGNGTDSIILEGYNQIGSVFLGDGKDYFKGFGSGVLNGGNGKDILELTSGSRSYTVGISGTTVKFTQLNDVGINDILITSEFEELIAGSTKYDFSRLTNGQTINVV